MLCYCVIEIGISLLEKDEKYLKVIGEGLRVGLLLMVALGQLEAAGCGIILY